MFGTKRIRILENWIISCMDEQEDRIEVHEKAMRRYIKYHEELNQRILILELALGNLLTAVEQDTKFTVNGKPLKDYVRELRNE